MKTMNLLLSILTALILSGCSAMVKLAANLETITPSGVIVSEERLVSGFTAIDMRTFGKVTLRQGEAESLTVSGSDNLVELVKTSVRNGVLVIETRQGVTINNPQEDLLTFEIVVKDLNELTLSGLGTVQMDALRAENFKAVVSGAGELQIQDLQANRLEVTVSGLGGVSIAGKAAEQQVEIPGAGSVHNGDLECAVASVRVSGMGSAKLWVTETLTGEISGSGSVTYYGDPQTTLSTPGLGSFKALGSK